MLGERVALRGGFGWLKGVSTQLPARCQHERPWGSVEGCGCNTAGSRREMLSSRAADGSDTQVVDCITACMLREESEECTRPSLVQRNLFHLRQSSERALY